MKKYLVSLIAILAITLSLNLETIYAVEQENYVPGLFSEEQREFLKDLGFTDYQIDVMPESEYLRFKDALNGDEILESVTLPAQHIKYSYDKFLQPTVTEVSPEVYNSINKLQENLPITMASTSEELSTFVNMTLTVTKLSSSDYFVRNNFSYYKPKGSPLSDVVAVTHQDSASMVPESELFGYFYTSRGNRIFTSDYISLQDSLNGVGVKFDVIGSDFKSGEATYDHSGYLSIKISKNKANAITTGVYGNYTKFTVGFTGFTIGLNSISANVGIKGYDQQSAYDVIRW